MRSLRKTDGRGVRKGRPSDPLRMQAGTLPDRCADLPEFRGVATGASDGIHRYVSPPELVQLVRALAADFSDAQIARILYRKRVQTPKGKSFKAYHVANVRKKHGIRPGPIVPVQGDEVYIG